MTTVDPATAARRGRMMTSQEVVLTVDDFAALLTATAWYPASPDVPITATEVLLGRCWSDLTAVNPELAQRAWRTALEGACHPTHAIALASLVAPSTQQKDTPQ